MDIFVRDLSNDMESRITSEIEYQGLPFWFDAGRRLLYSEAGTNGRMVVKNADGSGGRQELGAGLAPRLSPDGRHLIYVVDEGGPTHLRFSPIGADGTAGEPQRFFAATPEPDVRLARFSPDGRLIVYAERQPGGAVELFVTRFPSAEGRWQISSGGGRSPVWSRSGDLFYASGASTGPKQMMVVSVRSGENVSIGSPLKLFNLPEDFDSPTAGPSYDVTADGKRLVMVRSRQLTGRAALRWVSVQNWPSEFKK